MQKLNKMLSNKNFKVAKKPSKSGLILEIKSK